MSSPSKSENDWEEDDRMKRLRKRKQKLEDLEIYNSPETMSKKKRAVREQAKLVPAASSSTELEFDDAVGEANLSLDARQTSVDPTSKSKAVKREARKQRRDRAARRRKEAEANAAVAGQLGENVDEEPAPRGRRRKFRLRDAQQDDQPTQTKHSPAAAKAS